MIGVGIPGRPAHGKVRRGVFAPDNDQVARCHVREVGIEERVVARRGLALPPPAPVVQGTVGASAAAAHPVAQASRAPAVAQVGEANSTAGKRAVDLPVLLVAVGLVLSGLFLLVSALFRRGDEYPNP